MLTRDEDEKEAEEKNIYIGVLSSQYSSLEYLDGMSLDVEDENLTLKLVRFLAGDFPTDVQELGSLSGILIDSFDTSSLSQLQIRCLSSWVSEGGSLFVGTGTGAEVVLPSLEKMLKVKAEEVEEVQYSFTSELSRAGSARLYSSRLILEEKVSGRAFLFLLRPVFTGKNTTVGRFPCFLSASPMILSVSGRQGCGDRADF